MAFFYAPRLKRLPGAIFHSFSGTTRDAESLLAKGVNAYFSFGAPVLNGNKRAAAACASVPAERLLAETDAPWQPPSRAAGGGDFCRAEDLEPIIEGIAGIRGIGAERLAEIACLNFRAAYGIEGKTDP
jgi:TatD DNase family protein